MIEGVIVGMGSGCFVLIVCPHRTMGVGERDEMQEAMPCLSRKDTSQPRALDKHGSFDPTNSPPPKACMKVMHTSSTTHRSVTAAPIGSYKKRLEC